MALETIGYALANNIALIFYGCVIAHAFLISKNWAWGLALIVWLLSCIIVGLANYFVIILFIAYIAQASQKKGKPKK